MQTGESNCGVCDDPASLLAHYDEVRALTQRLCAPLEVEDYGLQSMPDASPPKWHLAHTTWFFETFLLLASQPDYRPFHPGFGYLFNSYYNAIGQRIARGQRGLLSRPTVAEVYRYRAHVDRSMRRLLQDPPGQAASLTVLGLHHEQQHQELLLTDVHHAFSCNPLRPSYRDRAAPPAWHRVPGRWVDFPGGICPIGHDGEGFSFDNECPRHEVLLPPFQLRSRLVTCEEYLEFMADGGYSRPELWLSEGWNACVSRGWSAPLYWERHGETWRQHTLNGVQGVREADPVCHVSYYEADAFARWAGARLPTEAEWEVASQSCELTGSFLDADFGCPLPAQPSGDPLAQMFGEAWQWTASPYTPYPGYRPAPGALGEYNGKFMVNQQVLRGGSCVTPRSHFRRSYRNFFPADARWQFTGLRLAKDS
jgi:ergothioneine biosynthesis protein EgtB